MGRSTAIAGFTDEAGACLFELLLGETRTWRRALPHRYLDHDKDCWQSDSNRMLTQGVWHHVRVLCTRLRAAHYEALATELTEAYRIMEHFAQRVAVVVRGPRPRRTLREMAERGMRPRVGGNTSPGSLEYLTPFFADGEFTAGQQRDDVTSFVRDVERIRDALVAANSGSNTSAGNSTRKTRDPLNERDKWLYDNAVAGKKWDDIRADLIQKRKNRQFNAWPELTTGNSVRHAVLRYIRKNPGLPILPNRSSGRPRGKK